MRLVVVPRFMVGLLLLLVALAACGSNDTQGSSVNSSASADRPSPTGSSPTGSSPASPVFTKACGSDEAVDLTDEDPFRITVRDKAFKPDCFIVSVDASVAIKNEDRIGHTWTIDGTLVNAPLIPGKTYTHGPNTGFLTPGTAYAFHCSIHPQMTGTMIVI